VTRRFRGANGSEKRGKLLGRVQPSMRLEKHEGNRRVISIAADQTRVALGVSGSDLSIR
jgi:hypothetical protein